MSKKKQKREVAVMAEELKQEELVQKAQEADTSQLQEEEAPSITMKVFRDKEGRLNVIYSGRHRIAGSDEAFPEVLRLTAEDILKEKLI